MLYSTPAPQIPSACVLLIVMITGCGRSQPEVAPDDASLAKHTAPAIPAVPETRSASVPQNPTIPRTPPAASRWPGHFNGRRESVVSGSAGVRGLAVSPDGRFVAVARQLNHVSGALQIWDVRSAELRKEVFEPHGVTALAFTPDSSAVAYGAGDRSLVWQPLAAERAARWEGHRLSIRDLAFSPDGKRLVSVGNDRRVIVWDIARGAALAEVFDDNPQFTSRVQFPLPDRFWTWNGNDRARWFDVKGNSLVPGEVLTLATRKSPMTSDGLKLYGLQPDRSLQIFDAATGQNLSQLEPNASLVSASTSASPQVMTDVMAIAVAKKSHDFAVCTADGRVTLLNGGDLAAKQSWTLPGGPATLLATNEDGRITAVATVGGGLLVCDRDQPDAPRWLERPMEWRGPLIASRFSAQATTVISADSKSITLSQTDDGRTRRRIVRPESAKTDVLTALVAGRDDVVLVGTSAGLIEAWKSDLQTCSSFPISKSAITALVEAPQGGGVLAGDADGNTSWFTRKQGADPVQRREHSAAVRAAVFSPDGLRAATAGDDQDVMLWEVATQSRIATLKGHQHAVQALTFSPDGARLVSGDLGGTVILWEVTTGQQSWSMTLPEALAAPPHRSVLPSIESLTSLIPRLVFVPQAPTHMTKLGQNVDRGITALAVSDDNRLLAVGTVTGYTKTFDLTQRQPLSEVYYQTPVSDLAFARDRASLLVASHHGDVYRCWQTPEIPKMLSGHSGSVRFAALDASGRRAVTAGQDKRLCVWDVDQGAQIQSLDNDDEVIVSGALSPDGRRAVTGGYGAGVVFWDLGSMKRLAKAYGHGKRVQSLAFSSDGTRVASGSDDHTARVWDFATRKTMRTIQHEAPVSFVTFSPDGAKLLTSTLDPRGWQFQSRVRIWDADTGKLDRELKGHRAAVNSAVFDADGRHLTSCGADGQICRWGVGTGERIHDSSRADGLSHAGLIDGGRRLVVRRFNNGVVIYDLATMNRLSEFDVPSRFLGDLGVASRGNRVIAATEEGAVYLWSINHE